MNTERNRTTGSAGSGSRERMSFAGPLLLMLCFGTASVLILISLYRIQIQEHEVYALVADRQHFRSVEEVSERGPIYAAGGEPLALTRHVYTIGITPRDLKSQGAKRLARETVIADLAAILSLTEDEVRQAAARQEDNWVCLKRDVDRETYDRLVAWRREYRVGGIAIDPTMLRHYPQNETASAVIGFVSQADGMTGVSGIEASYNERLSGRPGYRYAELDNFGGGQLPYSRSTAGSGRDGSGLVLNLHLGIQKAAQDAVDLAVERYQASGGGLAIVLNPHTGAILGMAQSGAYNLNDPYARPAGWTGEDWEPEHDKEALDYLYSHVWNSRAITDGYEPGSTYKALTAAIALDLGLVGENEVFSDDPVWVEGWTEYPISCSVEGGHGRRTLAEGLETSCNPVFVQLALRIGCERFYDYVRGFGHRAPTGIDLPGEASGLIHSSPIPIDLAVWSFGEQATVTPLQLLTAFAAFANDGVLMRPQIVARFLSPDGETEEAVAPEAVRQVISAETAASMLTLLRGVVARGTGEVAEVPGYRVAGKTSTSTHGENDEYEVISFAGLAPAADPEIAVLTVLYEPQASSASWPAQIACRTIIDQSLGLLGVRKSWTDAELARLFSPQPIRDVVGQTVGEAVRRSPIVNWEASTAAGVDLDSDQRVLAQYPPPGTLTSGSGSFYVSVDGTIPEDPVPVPDFAGLGLEEALRLARRSDLNLRLEGTNPRGVVTGQSPQPSSQNTGSVRRFDVITLHFG
ncbi:MAG: penicillin-binding transpeptidase domain-containing protein [Bacillota bacterium]|nr:penicillin-binding transpeptidase domain-containing protein [Bacillota bacterium]